ncbi:MAG: tetratricopeptide repeat protein [Pseudomonadota bacterium]
MKLLNPFPSRHPLSDCRKNTFAFITLSIIIFSIYSNSYDTSWHFDDEHNILDRKVIHLKELRWSEIKNSLFWGSKLYRPVSCLSLALNYYFGQDDVFGYHVINSLIHLISAFFLFLFIRHTLNLPDLRQRYGENAYDIALLASVFWASNPVQTQAVTYIVQRMASMAGMFYIMAMYFYIKARSNSQSSFQIILYILCAVASILSFGSKENTITLPMTLILCEILLLRGAPLREWFLQKRKPFLIAVIFALTITLIYLYFVQHGNLFSFMGGYERRTFDLKERLLTEPRIILFYITLLLYPVPSRLSLNHDIALSHSLLDPLSTTFAILLISCILIGAGIISKKRPLIAFSIFFFFLNHLVESTFIPLELIFEHRNYIPSMLLFVLIAVLFIRALTPSFFGKTMHWIIISFIILLLVGQGHSTYIRNFIWKTDESLWLDCIEKYPALWRPHHNLARYYEKNDRLEEAIAVYLATLTKKKSHNLNEEVVTYNNLGVTYQRLEKEDKAFLYYQEAEKIHPFYAPTHMNKGVLLMEKGLTDEAEVALTKAIQYDKNLQFAYGNLGFLQLSVGETDKAIDNLELALRKGPGNANIFIHLGRAYRIKRQYGKAFLMFRKSLEYDPHNPITLLHLAELFSEKGMKVKTKDAMTRFFNRFQGNDQEIQKFIEEMVKRKIVADAILPDRITLLTLLSQELRHRSEIYFALADFSLHKKSELSAGTVHSHSKE